MFVVAPVIVTRNWLPKKYECDLFESDTGSDQHKVEPCGLSKFWKKGLSKVGSALCNYNRRQGFFINLIEQYRA